MYWGDRLERVVIVFASPLTKTENVSLIDRGLRKSMGRLDHYFLDCEAILYISMPPDDSFLLIRPLRSQLRNSATPHLYKHKSFSCYIGKVIYWDITQLT
jgi:hypothetical protein